MTTTAPTPSATSATTPTAADTGVFSVTLRKPVSLIGGFGGDVLGLVAGGLTGLICYAPTFLVGLRLVNRGRLATA